MRQKIDSLDKQRKKSKNILADFLAVNNINFRNLRVYSWPQMWGSTACGFGGIGGAAMTEAQVFISLYDPIENYDNRLAVVFVDNRFAYLTDFKNIKEEFTNMEIPGKVDFEKEHENLYKKGEKVNG